MRDNDCAVTLYAVWKARDWTLADYLDAPGFAFETAGDSEWGPANAASRFLKVEVSLP